MIDVIQDTTSGPIKWLYILYDDNTVKRVDDYYTPGMPEPAPPTPPQGLYAPIFGFGKAWREQADVRQRLGWGLVTKSPRMTAPCCIITTEQLRPLRRRASTEYTSSTSR